MTVKVIRKAEPKQIKCPECDVLLEYENSDIKKHEYTCCGKPESDMGIVCPECKRIIRILRYERLIIEPFQI